MPRDTVRYRTKSPAIAADGWTVERLHPASRLAGANGLRTGKDGRIYVAQVPSSQITAVDPDTGEVEVFSPTDHIVGPDDLVFDDDGNLYCTEITEGRVTMLAPNGTTRVIYGDIPVANPITMHQGRLIAGECRPGGRIMELDRNGGAPRMILEDVPMPNAFTVGPDGKLYFPVMAANAIWRIDLAGGAPEVVADNLGVPDSVKFDSKGMIVSTQVASGQVLRIDPRTGDRTVLADVAPGMDNCTFVGERLFVSNIGGTVHEVLGDGKIRSVVGEGLQWPLGLAVGSEGEIFIADGGMSYTMRPGAAKALAGMFFTPGYPGYVRGVAASAAGEWIVTTATAEVSRFSPAKGENEVLSSGHGWLMGVAAGPKGAIAFADMENGRLLGVESGGTIELAGGLDRPTGVAIDADGDVFVAEAGAGRVSRIVRGKAETVIDGLKEPHGVACSGGTLYALDIGAQELVACDIGGGARTSLAANLPVGALGGAHPRFLSPIGTLSGALIPFAGIAASGSAVYIAGDAEGSVLAVTRG